MAKRLIKARKKFGKKMYRSVGSYPTKSDAKALADQMRNTGKRARVTKVKQLWVVWAAPKTKGSGKRKKR